MSPVARTTLQAIVIFFKHIPGFLIQAGVRTQPYACVLLSSVQIRITEHQQQSQQDPWFTAVLSRLHQKNSDTPTLWSPSRYHQAFFDNGAITILMEYMDKGSLADLLKVHAKIPERYVAAIARQTVAGLQYLHKVRASTRLSREWESRCPAQLQPAQAFVVAHLCMTGVAFAIVFGEGGHTQSHGTSLSYPQTSTLPVESSVAYTPSPPANS